MQEAAHKTTITNTHQTSAISGRASVRQSDTAKIDSKPEIKKVPNRPGSSKINEKLSKMEPTEKKEIAPAKISDRSSLKTVAKTSSNAATVL